MVWPHPPEAPKSAVGDLASEIEREIGNLLAQKQALEVQVANLRNIVAELGPRSEQLTADIARKTPIYEGMKRNVKNILKVIDDFQARCPPKDAA
jgi:hypothetical protein